MADQNLSGARKTYFAWFGIGIAVLAVIAIGYWWLVASNYVSTEDAYVQVSSAQVTPLTNGRVQEVRVHDSEEVHQGDVLVVIDPADAKLTLAQAEAAYGAMTRKVETYFAAAEARRADYLRTKLDYERRLKIQGTGAMSNEEFTSVRAAYEAAKAALGAAEALTRNTDVAHHPEVLAAAAQRDTAKLNLERTVIRAPVTGIVAQRNIQVGQMAAAGRPVMTVVPVADVYVEANFKEDQLAHVKKGQPVTLISDLYGSSAKFHGTVAGLGGGTGAAFAIIPAQNATGNWIKVVQRIPVRITLDRDELKAHPLRVGLSMKATIDVSN
ncbi:membrane fusion protein (multidrug efflux system) [Rhizomicrobium palustre]|uniref:Membrane fusion protein (Multidrug efflux system) n=1 Tax=Rhizomicrobium palustre TaxID=189966 RepID=A0A846MUY3_9PROT|nr:HlyD family secretion protein [Rhizomicrobium palustre]NIK87039.1 membrane fusion protein (multidrug efflux system) [Rhizomicrobium palustre]